MWYKYATFDYRKHLITEQDSPQKEILYIIQEKSARQHYT